MDLNIGGWQQEKKNKGRFHKFRKLKNIQPTVKDSAQDLWAINF